MRTTKKHQKYHKNAVVQIQYGFLGDGNAMMHPASSAIT